MQVTRSRGALIVAALLSGFIACGGQTDRTGEDLEGGAGSGGASGGASGGGRNGAGGSTPLDECRKGAPATSNPEQFCPWVGFKDELCYVTKEAACACACPRDRASTCISSLPGGPTDRVPVECY
jgi:hypothetical protein